MLHKIDRIVSRPRSARPRTPRPPEQNPGYGLDIFPRGIVSVIIDGFFNKQQDYCAAIRSTLVMLNFLNKIVFIHSNSVTKPQWSEITISFYF